MHWKKWGICFIALTVGLGSSASHAQLTPNVPADSVEWTTVATNLNFPEGPAWNAANQTLYVSNCYAEWMAEISESGVDTFITKQQFPEIFKHTNGLTVYRDGSVYGCEFGHGQIIRVSPHGEASVFAAGYHGKPFKRPNDLAFHSNGNLYFTDPGEYNRDKQEGRIFRVLRKSGEVELLADNLAFPNGIAVAPDEKSIYICESIPNRIWRYPLNDDGTLGERELFAELPGGEPDGIAFDEAGHLYVAHFGGHGIYVLDRNGDPIRKIITPGKTPSNVEFGGKDLKTLFVTEDETNTVYSIQVEVAGFPLFSNPARN